jgi:hypothetical protein
MRPKSKYRPRNQLHRNEFSGNLISYLSILLHVTCSTVCKGLFHAIHGCQNNLNLHKGSFTAGFASIAHHQTLKIPSFYVYYCSSAIVVVFFVFSSLLVYYFGGCLFLFSWCVYNCFLQFSQNIPDKRQHSTVKIGSSTPFLILYSLMSSSFDVIKSEILTASLINQK